MQNESRRARAKREAGRGKRSGERDRNMQIGWIRAVAVGILAVASAVVNGRSDPVSPSLAGSTPRVLAFSGQATVPSGDPVASGELVREIDDPSSGKRWLLMRDLRHPGGPGLLRLVSVERGGQAEVKKPGLEPERGPYRVESAQAGLPFEPALPVIRGGDRVIVEEHTPVADARLEAVALGPARTGAAFNARLTIGGWTVRAVAVGPGRAVLGDTGAGGIGGADTGSTEKNGTATSRAKKQGTGENRP